MYQKFSQIQLSWFFPVVGKTKHFELGKKLGSKNTQITYSVSIVKNVVSYFYVLLIASFVEGTTKTEFTDHNLKLKYLNLYENYWCQ